MRSPSMWVTGPGAERSKSPSTRETPTADPGASGGAGAAGKERGGGDHVGDGGDPADRLLGEREAVRHRAEQLAVDEHRAAAHAGDHAGLFERAALEARENQALAGSEHVLEDAEYLDLELVDPGSLEDRAPNADHAGTHLG